MVQQTNRKWTNEENEVLLRYVKANVNNLNRSFYMVAEHLTEAGTPRTKKAVAAHWYAVLSKRPDVLAFFTASAQHVSKNRKNGMGVASTPSIWRRLLNIIRAL